MGGRGSGNHFHWWRSSKKTTVEACLSLDANRWTREGILRAGVHLAGSWRWVYHSGQECSIGYEVLARDMEWPLLRLDYARTAEGRQEPVDYHVRLETTRPTFGGLRWWFICPLVVGGIPCGRRVGKLYLPPGGRYFGCRRCHSLTYTSCQEHDKRVDALRRNPELLAALGSNLRGASVSQLGLLLKALTPRK
jgi:hypothetical protein